VREVLRGASVAVLRLRAVAQHIPHSILEPLLALDDGERREGLLA